eukprot:TRINITY_DN1980_c0_g1_i1.p1 TRINITY_DN1980_c0_g1~~TRINITY_DN1980_c0_g1_i1.p1  ORF type:complete len:706 (+),score=228.59 TRINITY_DN1980_c0_g1_i1:721-2838(+)
MPESAAVTVAVRCRPFNNRETELNAQMAIAMDGPSTTITDPKTGKENKFTFDHSYFLETKQETVFNDLGKPILEKALDGYNGTIFAYGQTGSGKSFSMMGAGPPGGDLRGIIPRLNEELFERIDQIEDREFLVNVSYLEIYQEVIRDLLNPSDKKMRIREHPSLGIYVEGLAEIVVRSNEDIQRLMEQGNKMRMVAATNMNDVSSRSHACFTLKVAQRETDGDAKGLHAKINLVDLAGSERQASTGATGNALKEGAAINKSLAALGNVINALADTTGKKKFVPYRDSKLTRLLQESLGGNSVTVMMAALSPADVNYEETLSTLNYANRAKNIVNASTKNEDENARVVRELREEISNLRGLLASVSSGGTVDLEKMQRMEQMIEQLEMAKKQSWEQQEKNSKKFEQERVGNLQAKGLLETVMSSIKEDNEKIANKLSEIHAEKDKLIKAFKHQKLRVAKLKASLEENIQQYSSLCQDGRQEDAETQELLEKINVKKKALKEESVKLKDLKEQLKENADTIRAQKDEMRAHHFLLSEDSEIRKAIQDDEREKLAQENEQFLVAERQRLWDEMEEEKKRIRDEVQAKFGAAEGVNIQDLLDNEMKLVQEKADKELLMTKVGILTQENETLSNDLEEESLRSQLELEKQQLEHFQIFRRYREYHEEERRKMERKYMDLLDQTIKDAIYLSNRNAELETQVQEMQMQLKG